MGVSVNIVLVGVGMVPVGEGVIVGEKVTVGVSRVPVGDGVKVFQ